MSDAHHRDQGFHGSWELDIILEPIAFVVEQVIHLDLDNHLAKDIAQEERVGVLDADLFLLFLCGNFEVQALADQGA